MAEILIDREDDVLGYYDSQAEAEAARDRFYGPLMSDAELRSFYAADAAAEDFKDFNHYRRDYHLHALPKVRPSAQRPGKWYVCYKK